MIPSLLRILQRRMPGRRLRRVDARLALFLIALIAVGFSQDVLSHMHFGRLVSASGPISVTEFPDTNGSSPFGLATGVDGRVYYAEQGTASIATMSPSGSVTRYSIASNCHAKDITAGSDGALWFTEPGCNMIGRITTAGVITEYDVNPRPNYYGTPSRLTLGPDNNVWFTYDYNVFTTGNCYAYSAVGRITPAGVLTTFALPVCGTRADGIAVGADGNLWVAEPQSSSLARVTMAGVIAQVSVGLWGNQTVASGSDGHLWYGGSDGRKFGRLSTPNLTHTLYAWPVVNGYYYATSFVSAPDGRIWYVGTKTDAANNHYGVIGNIQVRGGGLGTVTDYILPTGSFNRVPNSLTVGPDDRLWYTDATTVVGYTNSVTNPNSPARGEYRGGVSLSAHAPALCNCGWPVNVATGDFWHTFQDLAIPGRGMPLDMTRTYNSDAAGELGALGYGWTFSYAMHLVTDSTSATVVQENGSQSPFTQTSPGIFAAPARDQATLVQNADGTYLFTRLNQSSYKFNSSGQLIEQIDLNGYRTILTYTGGLLTKVTDPPGRTLIFAYDASNRIASVVDTIGRIVRYEYDGSSNLVRVTDVGKEIWHFGYDANHLLTSMTDPNGGIVANVYDGGNNLIAQTDRLGHTTTFSYISGQTTVTDPNGDVTVYHFLHNELTAVTRGAGTAAEGTWLYDLDQTQSLGVTTLTDPNGNAWNNTRDASGNILTATDPLGRVTTNTYTANNLPATSTDALGVTTTYSYDLHGNLLSVSTPLVGTPQVRQQTLSYDPVRPGDVSSVTDADGKVWRYTFDTDGNLTSKTDPIGNRTTMSYDPEGRLLASVAPIGNATGHPSLYQTTFTVNAFGDPMTVTDPLGNVSTVNYDANRNKVNAKDANGHWTYYFYNAEDELTSVQKAGVSTVQNFYDADGNLVGETDGLGRPARQMAYNSRNQLVATWDAANRTTRMAYDPAGNLVSTTDPQGQTTTMAYDAANQLTAKTYSDGATPNVTLTHDADGQVVSMTDGTGTSTYTFDSLHRLTQNVDGAGHLTRYQYNLRGQVTTITYPNGHDVNRVIDDNGRLAGIGDWLGNWTGYNFDGNGNVVDSWAPNINATTKFGEQYTYDSANRLTSLNAPGYQVSYTRDAIGQPTAENNVPNSYDNANRLTTHAAEAYVYDSADQMLSYTPAVGSPVALKTYDSTGQLTSAGVGPVSVNYTYDARGNRVSRNLPAPVGATTYTYDQANRLTAVSGLNTAATYSYNGAGILTGKTGAAGATSFSYDLSGSLPMMIQENATSYIYGLGGQVIEQITNGTPAFLFHDAIGSTRSMTDATGTLLGTVKYDAYGNTLAIAPTVSTPFLYAGQYYDTDSRFYYMRARFYDPATAQFISRDPLETQTRHPYAYASDNPAAFTDPSGMCDIPFGCIGDAVNAVVSTVSNVVNDVVSIATSTVSMVQSEGTLIYDAAHAYAHEHAEEFLLAGKISESIASYFSMANGACAVALAVGEVESCAVTEGGSLGFQALGFLMNAVAGWGGLDEGTKAAAADAAGFVVGWAIGRGFNSVGERVPGMNCKAWEKLSGAVGDKAGEVWGQLLQLAI